MEWEEIFQELSRPTDSKIVLLVLDGIGGLPVDGRTELETAVRPNLDAVAERGICGITDPVSMGITPGSGPAHLGLFGYDPLKYRLGRGILEALGSGVEVGPEDLVARGNFATIRDGIIIDRRAGRITTEENLRLCTFLNEHLPEKDGVRAKVLPGKEHRFVVKFTGEGLADGLTDADPQQEGRPPASTKSLNKDSDRAAAVANTFLDDLTELLKGEEKANTALLRGFAKFPAIPTMQELFKLRPAAAANYPMYKGLGRLLGMEVLDAGDHPPGLFSALEKAYDHHDFFYVHFKRTDSTGEDGNVAAKVAAIEEVDALVPRILALKPDVLVVTGDHSTPCLLRGHSWHPNPFALMARTARRDEVRSFTEKACAAGMLGRFRAIYAMPLMLAHALKLSKYGA